MATEVLGILITPITEIAKLLVAPVKRQVAYLVKCHKNVQHLKREIDDLGKMRDSAKSATYEARRRGEAVNKDMEQWLKKADRTVSDVQKLLASQIREGWAEKPKTCCTIFSRSYVLSKRAVEFLKVIHELKGSVGQIPVSRPTLPPGIETMPTGDFEAFKSTKLAMSEIIEALNQDHNKVIGIYGMGGVGKTSLIREVAKYAKLANMFDEVVFATVSQNPDVKKIQTEIAEGLGLRLVEETEHVRSLRLAERLKQDSRILLVLDDVWERLELAHVGIPSRKDESTCKIAITTRNLDICSEMDCNVNIKVEALSQEDSWDLFKKVAGNIVDSPELNNVAKEVARECAGLPIALVTLGRVLRNKDPRTWDDAAYELRESKPMNIKGMHEKVFSCLKLSFDQIQNEESKLCYLYCSLFPEDYDVRVEDLLRYGIGEGLFSDVETVDEARNRVHSIISNLKASCLLLNGKREECIKMHDVFRDLAISITTSDDYSFMVKASSGLMEWPTKLKLEYVMRMSLIDNEFSMFTSQREHPELLLLLLQNNYRLGMISDEFFAGMRALLVLDLSSIPNLVALPPSLSCLTNLRTLSLENNTLQDGRALGGLISLEILSLRKSSFARFPEEIRRLTNLRLLDLTDSQVGTFPAKVISSLFHLEELYLGGSYSGWEATESEGLGRATLEEILSLKYLNTLHIDIAKYKCLTEDIPCDCPRLKKFQMHIGKRTQWQTTESKSIRLNLPDQFRVPEHFANWVQRFLHSTSELSVVRWTDHSGLKQSQSSNFQSVKHLHIHQCDLQACFTGLLFEQFKGLHYLQISSCFKMETVFHLNDNYPQNNVLLPSLTRMHIQEAPRLTTLWRGVARSLCFQSLQHVTVESCPQIKNVFSLAVAQGLNQLQYLEVSNCESLEAIICNEGSETERGQPNLSHLTVGASYTESLLPRLQSLKLINLKSIVSPNQPWYPLDFLSLKRVTVLSCPRLRKLPFGPKSLQNLIEIKADRKWLEELELEDQKTKLTLQRCLTDIRA